MKFENNPFCSSSNLQSKYFVNSLACRDLTQVEWPFSPLHSNEVAIVVSLKNLFEKEEANLYLKALRVENEFLL